MTTTPTTPASTLTPFTIELFQRVLPPKVSKTVNQELVDEVNKVFSDPDMFEAYRDNLVSYTSVMQDGKFTVAQYISAVKYVSHKLMGDSNIDAFTKTFPDKYNRYVQTGVSGKDIASYVTAYNKTKLVNLIFAQTIIPSHVINQDLYQKALNVQADLMLTANSEKVRTDAANSLLTHLKMPETKKVELDVSMKEDSSIAQLRQATQELVRQQKLAMESGSMNAKDMAHMKVVQSTDDVIDVEVRSV